MKNIQITATLSLDEMEDAGYGEACIPFIVTGDIEGEFIVYGKIKNKKGDFWLSDANWDFSKSGKQKLKELCENDLKNAFKRFKEEEEQADEQLENQIREMEKKPAVQKYLNLKAQHKVK